MCVTNGSLAGLTSIRSPDDEIEKNFSSKVYFLRSVRNYLQPAMVPSAGRAIYLQKDRLIEIYSYDKGMFGLAVCQMSERRDSLALCCFHRSRLGTPDPLPVYLYLYLYPLPRSGTRTPNHQCNYAVVDTCCVSCCWMFWSANPGYPALN